MTERPMADLVARTTALAATAAERAPLHRPGPVALEPDDYDAAAEVGAHLASQREATWRRSIPERFTWATLDDLAHPRAPHTAQPASVIDPLADWAAGPAGRTLLLLGPVGVGKSHAAVAAARPSHFDHGHDVRFFPVVELLDLMRPGGPDNALYDLADLDVLVIDDLGRQKDTDWTDERLYAVINRRWLEERPTVITTNLPPSRQYAPAGYTGATLDERLDEAVYSRVVGSGAVVVRMVGPDQRRVR